MTHRCILMPLFPDRLSVLRQATPGYCTLYMYRSVLLNLRTVVAMSLIIVDYSRIKSRLIEPPLRNQNLWNEIAPIRNR